MVVLLFCLCSALMLRLYSVCSRALEGLPEPEPSLVCGIQAWISLPPARFMTCSHGALRCEGFAGEVDAECCTTSHLAHVLAEVVK